MLELSNDKVINLCQRRTDRLRMDLARSIIQKAIDKEKDKIELLKAYLGIDDVKQIEMVARRVAFESESLDFLHLISIAEEGSNG